MVAVSLPCSNCCACNAIHDICLRCKIYFGVGDTVSVFGLVINDPDIFFTTRVGMTNYTVTSPGNSNQIATAPVSGDEIQITLKRSGADCTNCSGDFYSDNFSSSLDPGWTIAPGSNIHLSWATSGGLLVPTISAGGSISGDLIRIYLCESDAANYTVKFCLNGTVIHTDTLSSYVLGPSVSGIHKIQAGLTYHTDSGTPPAGIGYDNFFMDLDT